MSTVPTGEEDERVSSEGVFTCGTGIKPTMRRMNMSKDRGDQCSGVISSSFVITKP